MTDHAGSRALREMYADYLQVDPRWALDLDGGFVWWAFDRPQFVRVVAAREGPDGPSDMAYVIEVRTMIATGVDPQSPRLRLMATPLLKWATMAAPVLDEDRGVIELFTVVGVHDEVQSQAARLLSMAAILQVDHAWRMGAMCEQLELGENAREPHPYGGLPPEPHAGLRFVENELIAFGKQPSKWCDSEFKALHDSLMQRPPALCAAHRPSELMADFPFGDTSTTFRAMSKQAHNRYGNGWLLLQTFPSASISQEAGDHAAWLMNRHFFLERPAAHGYGLGSFCFANSSLHFCTFIPSAFYSPGLLQLLYVTAWNRAEGVARLITGKGWEGETYDVSKSSLARTIAEERAQLEAN